MPGHSLAKTTGATGLDRLRQQFAPKATDDDLGYFAEVCRHLDVDPWAGHICLIGRLDHTTGEMVHKPQLMVAGRRFIAQRTGHLRGIEGPMWCASRGYTARGEATGPLVWTELWDQDRLPYAARCLVFRDDWDRPANGTVKWSEFAQTYQPRGGGERRPTQTWAQMPSHMLGKVAESLALRRAFSEVESALAIIGGDDDTALMAEVDAEGIIQPEMAPRDEVPGVGTSGAGVAPTPDTRDVDGVEKVREIVAARSAGGPVIQGRDPAPDGSDELEARLMALPDSGRIFFRSWRRSRGYGWPPATPEALDEMSHQVDRLEEDLAADADTYGDDPA